MIIQLNVLFLSLMIVIDWQKLLSLIAAGKRPHPKNILLLNILLMDKIEENMSPLQSFTYCILLLLLLLSF